MSIRILQTALVLLLLPLLALAQEKSATPNPAEPSPAVPAPAYVSAFDSYSTVPPGQATPDQVWRRANEAVTRPAGHAGHAMAPAPAFTGKAADNAAHAPTEPHLPSPMNDHDHGAMHHAH